jgi:hypothetical protein
MEKKTRKRKGDWTEEQNAILDRFASKTWVSKKQLMDAMMEAMPGVNPKKALYHAVNHNKLDFNFTKGQLPNNIKEEASEMLLAGYQNEIVQQHISTKYGIFKNLSYYSLLKFKARRGEYEVVYEGKKLKLKSRVVARDVISEVTHRPKEVVESEMGRRPTQKRTKHIVLHPRNKNVSENDITDIHLSTARQMYVIKQLNFAAEILGLEFGTFIKIVDQPSITHLTPEAILKKIFKDSGLALEAQKLFNYEQA